MLNLPPGGVRLTKKIIRAEPPPAGRLLVCRHAHTGQNAGSGVAVDRIRGWRDVPLDKAGRQEAKEIGAMFQGVPVALIMTSDLSRAEVTARAIQHATGARLVTTPSLRPWNLGDFQGQASRDVIPQIHAEYVKAHPDEKVPGGESFNSFQDRFFTCLEGALARLQETPGETIVFVTSYRDVKTVAAWIKGGAKGRHLDMKEFMTDNLFPGAIFEICPVGDRVTGKLLSPGFDTEQRGAAS